MPASQDHTVKNANKFTDTLDCHYTQPRTFIILSTNVIVTSAMTFRQTANDPSKAVQDDLSTGVELDLADPITLQWEKLVAEVMLNHSNENITVLANVARR